MNLRIPLLVIFIGISMLSALPALAGAEQTEFFVYNAGAALKVTAIQVGDRADKPLNRTIRTNDLINLALGRSLGTRVDKATEVLGAAVVPFEDPSSAPLGKLIVFNPQTNVVTATVANLSELDYNTAYLSKSSKGQGFGSGTFVETALGDASQGKLFASRFAGSAKAKGAHDPFGGKVAITGVASISGRVHVSGKDKKGASVDVDGIMTKGTVKISGSPIGSFFE
ncbi:MAG: hypothetical protein ABI680_04725 [Chthoniobacteraceae bacterium]